MHHIRIFFSLLLLSTGALFSSCQKEEVTGAVTVTIIPVISSSFAESQYCSLYVLEGYPNQPALAKKYVGSGSFQNGKTQITFEELNPGNYVVTYYNDQGLVSSTVQAAAGKTLQYEF